MIKIIFFTTFLLSIHTTWAQKVTINNFNQFEERFTNKSDTLYLINFWATWCKPCVEELPNFLKINEEFKNKKFKLILVTLDFKKHLDSRVIPFLKKNNISAEVILLDDPDANSWISKVNKDWDGSIPVSKFMYKSKVKFYGTTLNYNELKNIIENEFNIE